MLIARGVLSRDPTKTSAAAPCFTVEVSTTEEPPRTSKLEEIATGESYSRELVDRAEEESTAGEDEERKDRELPNLLVNARST